MLHIRTLEGLITVSLYSTMPHATECTFSLDDALQIARLDRNVVGGEIFDPAWKQVEYAYEKLWTKLEACSGCYTMTTLEFGLFLLFQHKDKDVATKAVSLYWDTRIDEGLLEAFLHQQRGGVA